jgi:hypothetical protein
MLNNLQHFPAAHSIVNTDICGNVIEKIKLLAAKMAV